MEAPGTSIFVIFVETPATLYIQKAYRVETPGSLIFMMETPGT